MEVSVNSVSSFSSSVFLPNIRLQLAVNHHRRHPPSLPFLLVTPCALIALKLRKRERKEERGRDSKARERRETLPLWLPLLLRPQRCPHAALKKTYPHHPSLRLASSLPRTRTGRRGTLRKKDGWKRSMCLSLYPVRLAQSAEHARPPYGISLLKTLQGKRRAAGL